jgi:predicted dehydrogenase
MVAPSAGPVRWGILGAANIGVRKVIPAMQRGTRSRVVAIASRTLEKAQAAANELGIPRAYGSYEELLADPEIEAVYNPLPNHLHVPWTIRAAEAGKHVLCEKPIALSADEARTLLDVRARTGVQIGEAFMVRNHPQWLAVRHLVASGRIGDLRVVAGHFAYFKRDPNDVRSVLEWGGGGLMDVGCYPITMTRWLFGEEPESVIGIVDRDPELESTASSRADALSLGRQATFTCAMQLVHYQRMQLHGTAGASRCRSRSTPRTTARAASSSTTAASSATARPKRSTFPVVDQYTLQGDNFSAAIRGERRRPRRASRTRCANMAVIDAVFRSADSGRWERPAR